jgi:hypothetical protein
LREKLDEIDCDDEDYEAPTDFEAIINTIPFKSRQKPIQRLFTTNSRPLVLKEAYHESDPPPSLRKFNEFHPPKYDCMDTYSCPQYFFELWASGELQKQQTRKHNRRGRSTMKNKRFNKFSRTWTKTDVQKVKIRSYARHGKEFSDDPNFNPAEADKWRQNHLTAMSADSGFHSESDLSVLGMTSRDNTLKFQTISLTGIASSDLFGKKDRHSGTLSRLFSRKKSKGLPPKERAALRGVFELENGDKDLANHKNAMQPQRRPSTAVSEQMYDEIGNTRTLSVSDANIIARSQSVPPCRPQSGSQRQNAPSQVQEIVQYSNSPSMRRSGGPELRRHSNHSSVRSNSGGPEIMQYSNSPSMRWSGGHRTTTQPPPQIVLPKATNPVYNIPSEAKLDVINESYVNCVDDNELNASLSSRVEQLLRSQNDFTNQERQLPAHNGTEHRSDTSGIESDLQSSASSTLSGSFQKQLSNHPLLRKTLSQVEENHKNRSQSSSIHSSPLISRTNLSNHAPAVREPFYDSVAVEQRNMANHKMAAGYPQPTPQLPAHSTPGYPQPTPQLPVYANTPMSQTATNDRRSQQATHPRSDSSISEVIAVHVENNDIYYASPNKKTTVSHSSSIEVDDSAICPAPAMYATQPTVTPVQPNVTSKSFGSGTRKSLSEERRDSLQRPVSGAYMDLLAAIRKGKNLRKVDREQHQREVAARRSTGAMGFSALDVASILARRVAIEEDDDERQSSVGDNVDSDDDDWD